MDKFVNFGKRGVDLPAGCKDLIDLLQRPNKRRASSLAMSSVEGPAGVAQYLANLVKPGTKAKNLAISWHELNYVHLRNEHGTATALVVNHENTHGEQAVRRVFEAAGLAPNRDEAVPGWSISILTYPLPAKQSAVRALVSDLLRKGYGLAEAVRLQIASWEDDAC